MQLLYNILQIVGLIVFLPFWFVKVILTPKYRTRLLKRLGKGLEGDLAAVQGRTPLFWVHALSVGETSSSIPLLKALRKEYPDGAIVFSATTRSGEGIARKTLAGLADLVISFPFDLLWVVRRYVKRIAPDLLIMVETDFWPNFLFEIKKSKIPAFLVNGRVSDKSFRMYGKFAWLFAPLFNSFQALSMQTEADSEKMRNLFVAGDRVKTLGNLKYDMALPALQGQKPAPDLDEYAVPAGKLIWIAGSTHPGEEKIILDVFRRLVSHHTNLFLIIAPRNIDRADEIVELCRKRELPAFKRSGSPNKKGDVLILNTLGELSGLYRFVDLVFMGGSLVPEGGHNPLEPAAFGKPVLFGHHMEDFSEISRDILDAGAAQQIRDGAELFRVMTNLLDDVGLRRTMGEAAFALVQKNIGVTARHIEVIKQLLSTGRP